jgi:membrane protease YdiL (CAAX protease family)
MSAVAQPDTGRRLRYLIELTVALAGAQWFATLLEARASSVHVDLPSMPLLRHTYLFFLFVVLVFFTVRLRGEDMAKFGVVAPQRWLRLIGRGLLVFVAVMAFDMLVRPMLDPLVAHLTGTSRSLAEQHFAALKGNTELLWIMLPCGWLFGAFGEEFFYRGFVMTRIAQILGESRGAWIAALFLQALPFAFGHAYQGPVGMVAIYFGALITGTGTLLWGRNLWPSIIAHGLQDTLGFLALYYGVAHG